MVTHDKKLIEYEIISNFTNLFVATSSLPLPNFEDIIPSIVTFDENALLVLVPSIIEAKEAAFSLDPNSASALDGFTGAFFQACWVVMSADIAAVVQYFFFWSYFFGA